MAGVVLESISKCFDKILRVVDNVSLKVRDGEFLCLLGPSGCGKTTILRCIAGLEEVDSGQIYIGEKIVNDISPKRRDIAMVFQNYALYPHYSVFENIAYPLRIRKIPKETINQNVHSVAKLLKIDSHLDKMPTILSGGEQQRVALARAIVREPQAFLLDEPLSNVDALLRVHMRAEIKDLHGRLRITTIYVTHDQVEAMTMAERVCVLKDGRIQQVGKPFEIYDYPANTFVAGFIGNPPMNLIQSRLVQKNERTYIQLGTTDYLLEVPGDKAQSIQEKLDQSSLIVGVRPEHIAVRSEKASNSDLPFEVFIVEPLGSEDIISLKIGEDVVKIKTSSKSGFTPKGRVWIDLPWDRIHLFRMDGRLLHSG
jgi:multiple sugar transport system ATP-binding protein